MTRPASPRFVDGVLLFAWVFAFSAGASSAPRAEQAEWTTDTLADRIRGAWAGKMIGVVRGTPFEFRSCGKIIEGSIDHDLPTTVALLQDDLYVNLVFLEVLDDHGLDASMKVFADHFRDSDFGLFHANLAARRALLMGVEAPASGRPPHNLHADDIDFQIEADFIGLVCPGMPKTASDIAFRVGPIINYGDGVYGGVFVANLYALAFVEDDRLRLVERALQSIPAESHYHRCIETVVAAYRRDPDDWRAAWKDVGAAWDHRDLCPGGLLSPFNIDAKINGAYVVIALLFGGGDFERTVEIGVRCGQDDDCNPSTAAGILGAMKGYGALPETWRRSLEPIDDMPFDNVRYTLNSVVRSCVRLSATAALRNGGALLDGRIRVPVQSPAPPPTLEQWDDGLEPTAEWAAYQRPWELTGPWWGAIARGSRVAVAAQPPASAAIEFEGEGVLLKGCLIESGGRIDVRLDDATTNTVETYSFPRGMMPPAYPEEALWYSGPIAPGKHRLTVTLRDDKHPESQGRVLGLSSIVTFKRRPAPTPTPVLVPETAADPQPAAPGPAPALPEQLPTPPAAN